MKIVNKTRAHFLFASNRKFNKYLSTISIFVLIAFLNLMYGCYYYKVKPLAVKTTEISKLKEKGKMLIVHQGSKSWYLNNLIINENTQELSGNFKEITDMNEVYMPKNPIGANIYKPENGDPSIEVHLYITEYVEKADSLITIPISSVKKIELYDRDKGTTVACQIFTALGVIIAIIAIVIIIVLLTKSSCPFVYINTNGSYSFTGEIYGGAISPNQERDDYLPLADFLPVNDTFLLKISNELLEKQYTNIAELMLLDYNKSSKVLLDKNGNIQTISTPQLPIKALSNNNIDYLKTISKHDTSSFLFNEQLNQNDIVSSLQLSFKNTEKAKKAKLIIHAKNSLWLDYIYGKFNEEFGDLYNAFAESQKKVPAVKKTQWSLAQNIPLSVYIETRKGWKLVDYFDVIGPLASRDMVMPIDLSEVNNEQVNLKIESGFMFWELDYAALDFSDNEIVKTTIIKPTTANDENGNDVKTALSFTDKDYLSQPQVGNTALIKYKSVANEFSKRSVILHTRGYYEYIRDYKGKPDVSYLKSFKKKAAFTKFSKQHYDAIIKHNNYFEIATTNGNSN